MNLRNITLAALAAVVPTGFYFAHDFGDYDKARMVATTSIEIDAGKVLSISSNAIHWREDLFAKVKSGESKQFFNPDSWRRKIADAKVPAAMVLGGQAIGAGDWVVSIRVPGDDTSKFFLQWKQGEKAVDVPLTLTSGGELEDHLVLALTLRGVKPESKDFALKVGYGDMHGSIAGSFAGKVQ